MAHAIWSGSINFGLVAIPVTLYSAIREHEVHFHFLHAKDEGRIKNERVCSVCGKKVAFGDVVRGYEYEKDRYVVMKDEDFAKASPRASQSVDIVAFVGLQQISPLLFDVPYYLAPEKRGWHAYALLRDMLAERGQVGIARVVMRTREHLAALKPEGDALVIEMMHWADEVVPPSDLDFPRKERLSAAEKKMAGMLVDSMTSDFKPDELHDQYTDKLMSLIEARARGKPVPRGKERPSAPTNVVDLVKVLQKSLGQTRGHAERKKRPTGRARTGRPGRAA
jgi:DNA end-binding protein Ku